MAVGSFESTITLELLSSVLVGTVQSVDHGIYSPPPITYTLDVVLQGSVADVNQGSFTASVRNITLDSILIGSVQ